MNETGHGSEHPLGEKLDRSRIQLDGIDDLEPQAREADDVRGGDGTVDLRKSGSSTTSTSSANTGKTYLAFG